MTGSGSRRRGRIATRAASFPPVAGRDARVLVLGTMPGVASLAAREYYAHPRNAFWRILAERTGVSAGAPHARRCAGLRRARIALWDVARACRRAGSLDADIDPASVIPNDIAGLLARCPAIRAILFNGGPAERLFRRHVAPRLGPREAAIPTVRLPSTSPAHASRTIADKRHVWRAALDAAMRHGPDCDRVIPRGRGS